MGSDPKSLAKKPITRAKLLGQVLTPNQIALDMATTLMRHRSPRPLIILDPAVGPGTFPFALKQTGLLRDDDKLILYDVDKEMMAATKWLNFPNCTYRNVDYLASEIMKPLDMVIMNPPYVRQEWIQKKAEYRLLFRKRYGIDIPGTSNLYAYFVAKSLYELRSGGSFVAILYDSWAYTKFGLWLKNLINTNCRDIMVQKTATRPFGQAMIDAIIVSAKRTDEQFRGGIQINREPAGEQSKALASIDELFLSKRGLRLKQANFFICDSKLIRVLGATPFVKKSAKIRGYLVPRNHEEAALLISNKSPLNKKIYKELVRRLEKVIDKPKNNISILNWFKERPKTWFLHQATPRAKMLFNYYLRHRPRHILNTGRVYSDNFYGIEPRYPISKGALLALMNSSMVTSNILLHARNQGAGLMKIQLFEYRRVGVPDWRKFSDSSIKQLQALGGNLVKNSKNSEEIIKSIDKVILKQLKVASQITAGD